MIPVSATIATGGWASSEEWPASVATEARAEAIPSCDAAVGTDMNGRSRLNETIFAVSITRPPPTPIRKSAPFAAFSAFLMTGAVISSARKGFTL